MLGRLKIAAASVALLCCFISGNTSAADIAMTPKMMLYLAESGNTSVQNELADNYRFGRGGYEKDDVKALYWYRSAGLNGNGRGMRMVGLHYLEGRGGVPVDLVRSFIWMRKGAFAEDPVAQRITASNYAEGRGVAPNPEESCAWTIIRRNQIVEMDPGIAPDKLPDMSICTPEVMERAKPIIARHTENSDSSLNALVTSLEDNAKIVPVFGARGTSLLAGGFAEDAVQVYARLDFIEATISQQMLFQQFTALYRSGDVDGARERAGKYLARFGKGAAHSAEAAKLAN